MMAPSYVLVTGATGFIGAHIVDVLLSKGLKVRGATRSVAKGKAMVEARPEYASNLDFVEIEDFEKTGVFDDAVKGIDAIVHVASPFNYNTKNNEQELILPAINGVRSIMTAAASQPSIRRIVLTSSFASVMDVNRTANPPFPFFTYTGADWNPLTYAESIDPSTSAVVAYRGSKKFAEKFAWDFVKEHKPSFDLVTLCPPMTFGPIVHPVARVEDLNESNAMLWKIASGEKPLPVARVPFWIDVRDLATAHVNALLTEEAGGKRYVPASPERFSYQMAAEIIKNRFPWAESQVAKETGQKIDESHALDGETAARELGVKYRSFKETVEDLVSQGKKISEKTQQ